MRRSHIVGRDSIVTRRWIDTDRNDEGEGDGKNGEEKSDAEVVAMGPLGREDSEGEEEENAEDDRENGEIVWDAELIRPF